jgi:NTP pyrophosphatase (non-canonical NTP hydrolase)
MSASPNADNGITFSLKLWQKEMHALSRKNGFWDHEGIEVPENAPLGDRIYVENPSIVPEKLALITGEVSEALEEHRDDNDEKMEVELADIIIRVLDLAEWKGFDMDRAVEAKHKKNLGRPYLHGRKR